MRHALTRLLWRGETVRRPSLVQLARDADKGRDWYRDSGESVTRYATKHGLAPSYVADVVAILSPRVSVSYGATLARRYMETGACPGAMSQRVAALAKYEATGRFNGLKVNAFSKALQGEHEAVVIDAWMARLFNAPPKLTPTHYKRLAAKVKGVATRLGWPPSETQAALWVGTRGLCGYKDDYTPLRLV